MMATGGQAHIVIVADSIISKRISAVEMARRLRRAGYRITLLGPGGEYENIDGFDYFRVDLKLNVPRASFKTSLPSFWGLRSWFATYGERHRRRDEIVKAIDVQAYRKLLKKLSPDLLLIDIEAHSYIIPAITLPTRLALFSVFFNLFKSSEAPPLHTDIIPGRGNRGKRYAISLTWIKFFCWKWVRYQLEFFRHCGVDQLSLLKYYCGQCGVRWQDYLDCYQWLIPFLYRSLPTLVLNPLEMEFTSTPPPSTTYVGPMICTNRAQLPFLPDHDPVHPELQSLLNTHHQMADNRRLVYCGFGSFFSGDDTGFLKEMIAAAEGREWHMVIALGGRGKSETFGTLPTNVTCLRFAPQLELLAAANAAVIHGGMTSVYECIHHGVPMVVYPFAVNDQYGTAARVAQLGLGIVGNRSEDRAEDIRNKIERILDEETIQKRVALMQHCLVRYKEENTVAEAVSQLMAKREDGARSDFHHCDFVD